MRTEEKEVEAEKSLCLILCFYPSQQSVRFIDFMVCVHEIQRELCMQKLVSPRNSQIQTIGGIFLKKNIWLFKILNHRRFITFRAFPLMCTEETHTHTHTPGFALVRILGTHKHGFTRTQDAVSAVSVLSTLAFKYC